jgi:hypothetical protein
MQKKKGVKSLWTLYQLISGAGYFLINAVLFVRFVMLKIIALFLSRIKKKSLFLTLLVMTKTRILKTLK